MSRLENLLGALSVTVTDRVYAATDEVVGRGASAVAALVTLATFEALSIDGLRRHLGLSHPAVVRLVDRLVADGLLERRPSGRGRTLELHLTAAGRGAAQSVEQARLGALSQVLSGLEPGEREALTALVERLLAGLVGDRSSAHRICRLCEQGCSEAAPQGCPVDQAVHG